MSALLTRFECQLILDRILYSKKERGSLVEYEIAPDLASVGYICSYSELLITYRRQNETNPVTIRLFIKSKPSDNQDRSDIVESSGILVKEATIYLKLLNEIRKFSPKIWCALCYFRKHNLFVIQNVLDLDYEQFKTEPYFLKPEDIKSTLRGLAVMHASSLAYEEENKVKIGDILQKVLFEATVAPDAVWFKAGIEAIIAVACKNPSYSEKIQKIIREKLPSAFESVYEMVNPSTKYCNVLCHRDIWSGNLFFSKTEPAEKCAIFVDFQLSRYSPAAIDVLMALFLNMPPSERKLIEQDCYEFYYKQFSVELSSMGLNADNFITHDQFLQSIEELKLFGALYNCIAATILRVPGNYLSDMRVKRPDRFHHYTHNDRTIEVLKLMDLNSDYKAYLFECIDDVMPILLDA